MSDGWIDEFNVRVGFDNDRPTVAVVGDVDVVTSTSLTAVINALIDGDYREIVVDLSELRFIDAQGLSVLAVAAKRVNEAGGVLTLRALPTFARRLLDITRDADLVTFDNTSNAIVSRLERHQGVSDELVHRSDIEAWMSEGDLYAFARSSTDLIDAALRLVTALASSTVDNADGVSVTLERDGRLLTVAASNDAVLTMDHHQYETGQGPCLDATKQGRHFYIESLEHETRWPEFVPLALEQGIHSILSSPLMTHEKPQGALNIYSASDRAFGTREHELAALFAEQASEILATAIRDGSDEGSKQRFAAALAARRTIHQAQGVLMALHDLSAEEAFGSLFQQARDADATVLAHANDVVSSLHPGDRPS